MKNAESKVLSAELLRPLIWLRRFRQRRGYGVQSPFAFQFITQVILNNERYYAFEWLDLQFPRWTRALHLLALRKSQLLFRLANHQQPKRITASDADKATLSYLHQGCTQASISTHLGEEKSDLLYLRDGTGNPLDHVADGGMIVLDNLPANKDCWEALKQHPRTTLSFDLYYIGIIMVGIPYQRQDYIVNW